MAIKSVLITRQIEDDKIFRGRLQENGYSLHAESLIRIVQIRYSHAPKADWIFFSSKNAIKHFFAQGPDIHPRSRFAVFSESSARYLRQYNHNADFIGSGNDTTKIARKFSESIDGEVVLFPQAIDSLQTVQRWLPFNNISKNLFVYKTELKEEFILPEADILVFTSPSNVRAFFSKYSIKPGQSVIAIGTTTQISLRSRGVQNIHLPAAFDESSLLDKVLEVIEEKSRTIL